MSLLQDDNLSKTIKKLSPGGKIIDIKIKLNTTKEIDPVLISLWKKTADEIKDIQKNLNKYAISEKDKLIDNVDFTQLEVGKHKVKGQEFEGCLIEFLIEQDIKLDIGNKMSNRYGAKGVVGHIIPEGKAPKAEYSGNIDIFVSPIGVMGRKNTSILKELYMGKILYNLEEITAQSVVKNVEKTRKIILEIYNILDNTDDKKIFISISSKLNGLQDKKLVELLVNKQFRFNIIIPPFTKISFDDLKKAADVIKIPLDERVYIPETDTWTRNPVPVGINYFRAIKYSRLIQ
jgi:DNA-directed RNA polymerase beta subunit